DLAKQRKDQQDEFNTKLKEAKSEIQDAYQTKALQLQVKAETTIRALLSHTLKSLAETQQVVDHMVSSSMLPPVQQLGGLNVKSVLVQMRLLQESLDNAIEKLTYEDTIVLAERIECYGE